MKPLTSSIAAVFAMVVGASAAERGAAAGSAVLEQRTIDSVLVVESEKAHQLFQSGVVGTVRTPDRIGGISFDGAEFRVQEQADLVDGAGLVRGYGVWQARSGEILQLVFGYSIPPRPPGEPGPDLIDGTFDWIGGTGALQGIRGKGTLEGERTATGKIELRWTGSYEQP